MVKLWNSIINNLFPQSANPEDYGWVKDPMSDWNIQYSKPNGWTLKYTGYSWVLDKSPKSEPGVISRYGKILTDIDIEEASSLADNVVNPSRVRAS